MAAWHGSQELKDRIVARMRKHREADDFIKGVYQRVDPESALGYRGCAIGCTLDRQPVRYDDGCSNGCCAPTEDNEPSAGWHYEFERQFGIPWEIASVIDDIYEALRPPQHAEFAIDALETIRVGADLSRVIDRFDAEKTYRWEHDRDVLLALLAEAPVPDGGEQS